jgi:hypothetical protein
MYTEVFSNFLLSLYTMEIRLNHADIIPLLILYDKYLVKKHKNVSIYKYELNSLL